MSTTLMDPRPQQQQLTMTGATKTLLTKSANKKQMTAFNRKHKFNIATKFCLAFCRTGLCKKGAQCPFSHTLEKVAICKKFLYGKCKAPKCFLSHNSTQDNMPDCNFYLKGYCKEESCRYRHVKVNAGAAICRDFVTGFCSKGAQCESLHQFLCKSFFKTGQCPKGGKCTLAHLKAWPTARALSGIKRQHNPHMMTGASSSASSSAGGPSTLLTKVATTSSKSVADAAAPHSKYRKVNSSAVSKSSTPPPPPSNSAEKVPTATTTSTSARPNREMLNSLLTKRLRCNSESNKQIVSRQDTDGRLKIDSSTEYIALFSSPVAVAAAADDDRDNAASTAAAAAAVATAPPVQASQVSVISSSTVTTTTTTTTTSSSSSGHQLKQTTTTTTKNNPGKDPKKLGKYPLQAASYSSVAPEMAVTSSAASAAAAQIAALPPAPQPKRPKYFVVDHDEEKLSDYLTTFPSFSFSSSSVDSICRPQLKIIPDFLLRK